MYPLSNYNFHQHAILKSMALILCLKIAQQIYLVYHWFIIIFPFSRAAILLGHPRWNLAVGSKALAPTAELPAGYSDLSGWI
jgi:hypothetical protein